MIEQLFGSKTRVKLLKLFLSNPNRSFYVREITRKIDEQINSVRRELANLLSIGIISSDTNNNRLYYEVNQKYEFYDALRAVFADKPMPKDSKKPAATKEAAVKKSTPKTTQAVDEDILMLGNVDILLLTGQFTRDEASGIDLLVVGDINSSKLKRYIDDLEKKEKKEIRYTVMDVPEYQYREQIKDRFLTTVISSKKQVVIDKNNRLE